ncbi:MAG: alpha-amylase family glycosyl hydrolase, partial [Kiritimatiellae bacterium]|nr:alpha-amylase family glycosyl hydrolase [Kiritimatiellia bacterium]
MIFHATRQRIRQGAVTLYGNERGILLLDKIERLCNAWAPHIRYRDGTLSERDTLLITYADTLLGPNEPPLRVLGRFLTSKLGDLFTLVHLLPFYPFSSDDGFAVQDFRSVRPDLGSWEDIAELAKSYRLVFDAVVNHVSSSSGYMKSYEAGEARFANFFIEGSPGINISSVVRTRNLPLFHEFTKGGKRVSLWTTFG